MMLRLFQKPKCSLQLKKVSDILLYVRHQCQRMLDLKHIENLIRDASSDMTTYGQLTINQTISVAQLPDGTVFILDGQHRAAAFSKLSNDKRILRSMIPVSMYTCADYNEVIKWYQRLNSNLPIHPLELEIEWVDKVRPLLEHIEIKYKCYISKNERPRCPNISMKHIKSALQEREKQIQEDAINSQDLVDDFEQLQTRIKERIPQQLVRNERLLKCFNKQCDNPCFIALGTRNEWLDIILYRRLNGLDWDALDLCAFESPSDSSRARCAIPKKLRRKVWAKCNKGDTFHGVCYVCNETLDYEHMECGHDVPHVLGGKADLENLYPLCKTCNRDMGIQRLHTYRKRVRSENTTTHTDVTNQDEEMNDINP